MCLGEGEKLLGALEVFPIQVEGRVCLDGGISTGGFTDCLLQHGASRVYGIDVGYGQTAWSLRTDSRVVLKERTNLRRLTPEELYGPDDPRPDLAVADVSFISLRLVMPAMQALLTTESSEALLLVKPQFEVGKERVGKGGGCRTLLPIAMPSETCWSQPDRSGGRPTAWWDHRSQGPPATMNTCCGCASAPLVPWTAGPHAGQAVVALEKEEIARVVDTTLASAR